MTAKPCMGLYCVCDPKGELIYNTVSTDPALSIEEWIHVEGTNYFQSKMSKSNLDEARKNFLNWDEFEIEGYTVVPVVLMPCHLNQGKDRLSK